MTENFASEISRRPSRVERWVGLCARHAALVVGGVVILAVAAAFYVATHFSLSSDTQNLLSMKLPYRQRAAAFDRLFEPQNDQIVIVIDGQTSELAEAAAAALEQKIAARTDLFRTVSRPEGGFFLREGLLYLPTAEVRKQMDQLVAAQPFLGPLAADPSLRGLMSTLSTAATGVSAGQAKLDQLATPIAALSSTIDAVRAGKPAWFSWSALLSNEPAGPATRRRLVLATPVLDFSHLESGSKASQFIRDTTDALRLDAAHGVAVKLTGPIPLQDEQFGSIARNAGAIAAVALAAILFMLWMAVRAPKLIGAILATMLIGLVAASAIGLLIFHKFNVISVAFIPLFVGLGIDFGIQFTVRFRTEFKPGRDLDAALRAAGAGMGRSLILAATAIAVGFLAFAPTAYLGVSQLGVIAGVGMFVAVALNLTFLPSLICLLRPDPAARAPISISLSRLDAMLLSHRRTVLGVAVAAAAASACLIPFLRFDFNPFHLENPRSQAVIAALELMHDPNLTPNSIDVVAPSLAAANSLAPKLQKLSDVAAVRTLSSFVPDDQAAKLASIADAAQLLGFSLDPIAVQPPPSDAQTIAALRATAADLRAAAAKGGPAAAGAKHLADDLGWLASAPPEARLRARTALIPGLDIVLAETRNALQAAPVTLQSLPPSLTHNWLTPSGVARLSIVPKGDANDNRVLSRFIEQVRTVAPEVTGESVGIYEGGKTIAWAFIEAGVLSFIAITLLLFIVLKRPRYVAITMAPIVLTGLLTLGTCVVIRQPLNYANIIALPLLFGIGVAFHIYFVMAWRNGAAHLLQSSLTRAIFFSALATATGFGSLWASQHPGTASMGELLMISLVFTLGSALLFQPALMGDPPSEKPT